MPGRPGGTRIRIFPEYAEAYSDPELVVLATASGEVRAGPSDDRFYVSHATRKLAPYDYPSYVPPYRGEAFPVVHPDRSGHFDHLAVTSPAFMAAHIYGAARFTLDVWERYFGRRVVWWHAPAVPRLELVPVVHWPNAHSGPGFLETGIIPDREGTPSVLGLNFGVTAHEIGHAMIFSQLGVPGPGRLGAAYLALHESFADLVGLIGVLHFPSVRRKLLEQTSGNLYVLNLVSRIGELSTTDQIRIASNVDTMRDVEGLRLLPDGTFFDPTGRRRNEHALAQPLTGAIFDVLVEMYQHRLVRLGLIPAPADARSWSRAEAARTFASVHQLHGRAVRRFADGFERAIIEARDRVGFAIAHALRTLDPGLVTFERVAARFLEGLWQAGETVEFANLVTAFLRRGIDPREFLTGRGGTVRVGRETAASAPPARDPLAFAAAGKLFRHEQRAEQLRRRSALRGTPPSSRPVPAESPVHAL